MASLNKEELASSIAIVLECASRGLSGHSDGSGTPRFFPGEDLGLKIESSQGEVIFEREENAESVQPSFYLRGDGVNQFQNCIWNCLRDEFIGGKIGAKAVEKQIVNLVRDVLAGSRTFEDPPSTVRALLKALRSSAIQRKVFIPIPGLEFAPGLQVSVGEVSFGASNLFMPIVVARYDQAIQQSAHTEEDKPVQRQVGLQALNQFLANRTLASVEITASQEFIPTLAAEKVRSACSLFQFYSTELCNFDKRPRICPDSDVWSSLGAAFSFDASSVNFNVESHGHILNMPMSVADVDFLVRERFFIFLSDCFLEDASTSQVKLKTAIWWHSRATLATSPAESLVDYVISIERLVIKDNEESTSDRFCSRLAWLIASEDRDERIALAQRLPKIYNTRSRIVHSGATVVDPEDLKFIEHACYAAILEVCRFISSSLTHEQMVKELEARKLG